MGGGNDLWQRGTGYSSVVLLYMFVCVCVAGRGGGGGGMGGWMCVLDQVLSSLMHLYTKKNEICSLYRLAAGEKILHMESFAWLYK